MKCLGCKTEDGSVIEVLPGKPLCAKCRKMLRRARRTDKRNAEVSSYYSALTHPEYRGLKGVRK